MAVAEEEVVQRKLKDKYVDLGLGFGFFIEGLGVFDLGFRFLGLGLSVFELTGGLRVEG